MLRFIREGRQEDKTYSFEGIKDHRPDTVLFSTTKDGRILWMSDWLMIEQLVKAGLVTRESFKNCLNDTQYTLNPCNHPDKVAEGALIVCLCCNHISQIEYQEINEYYRGEDINSLIDPW